MDATRSESEYVYRMLTEVIDAGATTVNIPDTVGYAIPEEFAQFLRTIQENVPNIHKARISVHCHNDLGLAVANSLAAVSAGARQIETCINGIGERAGNASLEEVVMAIKTRPDFFHLGTNIDSTHIHRTSRLVSQLTGMSVQPNKAIVGVNAFRHQSGIHQHGITKMRQTYEIIDPADIGLPHGTTLVLNKNSGRHGLKSRLDDLGYEITTAELDRVFVAFKDLADKKGEIDDRDLDALVSGERRACRGCLQARSAPGLLRQPVDPYGDGAHRRPRGPAAGEHLDGHRAGRRRLPRDQRPHRRPEPAHRVRRQQRHRGHRRAGRSHRPHRGARPHVRRPLRGHGHRRRVGEGAPQRAQPRGRAPAGRKAGGVREPVGRSEAMNCIGAGLRPAPPSLPLPRRHGSVNGEARRNLPKL